MDAITVLVCLLIFLIIAYWYELTRRHNYFARMNVSGPRPAFLFGHLHVLSSGALSYTQQLKQWTSEFGSIYGIFEGAYPVWVSSDVNFLYEIYIKQFTNFQHRKPEMLNRNTQEKVVHLFDAKGSVWKRQRWAVLPMFGSKNLKNRLSAAMFDCTGDLLGQLEMYCGHETCDMKPLFQKFAFECTSRNLFGMDKRISINYATYLEKCKNVDVDIQRSFLAIFDYIFPELSYFTASCFRIQNRIRAKLNHWASKREAANRFKEQPTFWLLRSIRKIVDNISPHSNNTVLEFLLASSRESVVELRKSVDQSLHKYMLHDEITNNMLLFLLAGSETIGSSLCFCVYVLAKYPHEQDRVYREIRQSYTADLSIENNMDCLESFLYLDLVIRETLRLYPISITAMSRQCTATCHVLNYSIQKGDGIQPDILSIHHDIELWGPVDPAKFYPDRFRTKRHRMAWLPFGAGPRTCLGMKMALEQIKAVLVTLLRQFEFELSNDTELKIIEGFVRQPENLCIRVKRRTF